MSLWGWHCHTSATSQLWAGEVKNYKNDLFYFPGVRRGLGPTTPPKLNIRDERAELRPPSPETSRAGSDDVGVMWQLERKDKQSMVKTA